MIRELFRTAIQANIDDWHKRNLTFFVFDSQYPPESIEYLVGKVTYHNYQGWHYEDYGQCDEVSAVMKGWLGSRDNNRNRNSTIQAIDAHFKPLYQPSADLHTESLGVILDKISILYIKYRHLSDVNAEKGRLLLSTIDSLVEAAQTLYEDVVAGRRQCLVIPHLKLYDVPSPPRP